VVVCGDPTMRFYGTTYMNHPDHRVAADVTLDAVFPSAGTRLIFPELLDEGLDPHEVRQVYIHGAERADTWVDIGETLDLKLAALRAHKSQMGEWDPDEMITQWAREQGKRRKLPAAEAYRRMVLQDP
jgi:LmbE family N-acetylglucosaminyl deacetylase